MQQLKIIFLFIFTAAIIFSCKKESGPDYRDNFVGEYIFTKYQNTHTGGYEWTDDGPDTDPYTVWTTHHDEEIVWQATGTIEKIGRKTHIHIRYGNGEEYEVSVSTSGQLYCLDGNCNYFKDEPSPEDHSWHFSEEGDYFLDLGNDIPDYGLPYGGWTYHEWRIEGAKQ